MLNSVDFPAAQRLYYDQLFNIADVDGDSYIGVNDSAFFRKSGLPNNILGEVWQLADIRQEGRLDKEGFVIAMSLISLAQQGKRLGLEALRSSVPQPPKLQDIPPMKPDFEWAVNGQEKRQWIEIFRQTDEDGDGFISGLQARTLFSTSGLPLPLLSQIWGLADINKDQKLDQQEFLIAMFLISVKRRGYELPQTIPESLIVSARPDLSSSPTPPAIVPPKGNEWVIPIAEKVKYDDLFKKTDTDVDGYILGDQARGLFLKSNVSMPELSRIWHLSDLNQDQKLDRQEFAIAMFLIRCRIQGREIPTPLPEALIASARDDFVPSSNQNSISSSKDNKARYDVDLGDIGNVTPPIVSANPTSPIPPAGIPVEGSHQGTGGPFLSGSMGSPAIGMSPAVSSAPAVLQPGAPQFSTLSPTFGSVQIVPSPALEVERARISNSHHERTKAEMTNQLQEISNAGNEAVRLLEEEKARGDTLIAEIGELESQIGAQRARGASYKDNITAIRLEVKNMTTQKDQLEELLKEKQIQCEDQEQILNDLRIELTEKTNEAERYQREIDLLKTRLETLRTATADIKSQLLGAKKHIIDNKSEIHRLTEETKGLKTASSSPPLTTRSSSPLSISHPNIPTLPALHPPITRTSSAFLPETTTSAVSSPALPHASSLTSSPTTTPFSFPVSSSTDTFSFDNGHDDPFAYPSKDGFGLSSVTSDSFGAPVQASPSPPHPTQDTPVFNDANSFFATSDAFGEPKDPFTNSSGSGNEIVAIADPFATSSSFGAFGSSSSDSFSNSNSSAGAGSVSQPYIPPTPHNTIVSDRKGGLSGTDIASAFSSAAFGGNSGSETTTSFFGTNEETFGASAFASTSDSFGAGDSFGSTHDAFGSGNLRASGGFHEPHGGTTPFPSVDQASFAQHGGTTPFPSVDQASFAQHGGTTPFPSVDQENFHKHGGTTPFPSVDQVSFHKHGGTTPFPSVDQATFHKHGGTTPFPSVDQANFHKHGGTTPFPSVDQESLKAQRGSGGFQGMVIDESAFAKRGSGSHKAVVDDDEPTFATETPFGTTDAFGTADAFGSTNAFASSEGFSNNTNDVFGSSSDAFGSGNDAFGNDIFGKSDAFGSAPNAFGHDDGSSLTSSGGGSVAEESRFGDDVFGKPSEGFGAFNFDSKKDGFDF